jgi:hypothetical protein
MRRIATLGLVASLLAPAAAIAQSPVSRATSLLGGKRFTRFVETGSIGVPSSFDQRLHLCSDGRFILDEVSSVTGERRTTGTWRVLAASFRVGRGVARVRGVPAGGRPVVIVIATGGGRTTVDGNLVIAERSDLCR